MKAFPLLKTTINKTLIAITISTILIISTVSIILLNFNNQHIQERNSDKGQTQKKLDDSEDWVYDADYGFENKVLKDPWGTETFNSKEMLIVPYIIIKKYNNKWVKHYEDINNRMCSFRKIYLSK